MQHYVGVWSVGVRRAAARRRVAGRVLAVFLCEGFSVIAGDRVWSFCYSAHISPHCTVTTDTHRAHCTGDTHSRYRNMTHAQGHPPNGLCQCVCRGANPSHSSRSSPHPSSQSSTPAPAASSPVPTAARLSQLPCTSAALTPRAPRAGRPQALKYRGAAGHAPRCAHMGGPAAPRPLAAVGAPSDAGGEAVHLAHLGDGLPHGRVLDLNAQQ